MKCYCVSCPIVMLSNYVGERDSNGHDAGFVNRTGRFTMVEKGAAQDGDLPTVQVDAKASLLAQKLRA